MSTVRGSIKHREPLSRHTSWRVGGPARTFFEPADREDLISFVRALPADEPLLWLGQIGRASCRERVSSPV